MSLSIQASGRYPVSGMFMKGPSPEDWLEQVRGFLEKREGDDLSSAETVEGPEGPVLLAQVHPAAEALSISAPGVGRVEVSAATHLVGPGYHLHVLELLDALAAELGVTWSSIEGEDDAPVARDLGAIERLLAEQLGAEVNEMLDDESARTLLPASGESFLHGGFVATPLGPRDRAWAERAAKGDPLAARDAWTWKRSGRDAEAVRDRAVTLMWTEVRWGVQPEGDGETELWADISARLAKAHAMDPALPMPWREWAEILRHVEPEGELAREVAAKPGTGPLVGYRRGDVLSALPGGFRVRLPGTFRGEVDEDGTWSASDGARALYVGVRRAQSRGDSPGIGVSLLRQLDLHGEPHAHQTHGVAARAALRQEEDEETGTPLWVLSGGVASGPFLARTTLTFVDPADREWALATWRSIVHPGSGDSGGGGGGGLRGITS